MHVAEELREQAVTAHGVADTGLAVQLHEHHRGHADEGAQVHDHREPVHAGLQNHAGHRGVDVLGELLVGHHAGHDQGHDDVEHGGNGQGQQNAARQRLVRVDGLLSGRGHGIEADEAEEHDGSGRHDAVRLGGAGLESVDAVRGERLPVGRLDIPHGAHDEQHDDGELDEHHHVIGALGLVDADGEHPRDDEHDDETGQVEVGGDVRVGAVGGGQLDRQVQAEAFQQFVEVARPAGGHCGRLQGVLQNQIPADHEGDELAERQIGIGVGRAGHRGHGGELGVAQTGKTAADGGQQERHGQGRAGGQRALAGEHEDTGADDRADAEHRQIEGAHRALEGSGFGDKLIHAFLTKQIHVLLS